MNRKIDDIDTAFLIRKLREGDEQAFKVLFEQFSVRLYHFSLRYLHDREDAEDLLHDVFLKIWANRMSLKTDTSFRAYLFTIAYNQIRQRFLKRSREERYLQRFAAEYVDTFEEDRADYLQFLQTYQEAVALLPPKRREIFEMRYQEAMKNQEIADRLGITEQFVKNQLSIARKFVVGRVREDSRLTDMLLFCLFAGN
ncbi:MAG: RNA polymerase sigma-70 factor [Mangrovibacterium sp.]|nr:RNA polymerase sigma-70 factor [Mangrovibacterium sp.]